MEPEGRCPLVVGVLEGRGTRIPLQAVRIGELVPELVVERAHGGESRRNVVRAWQVPRFRVAVALLGGMPTVQVRDDRYGAGVRTRRRCEGRPRIPPGISARRVRPVQGGVDRQQVREETALAVDEIVHPGDPDRPVYAGLDGERRVVERAVVPERAVSPQGGGRQSGRQYLLAELPDADDIRIDAVPLRVPGLRHHRRDHQVGDVFRDGRGVQGGDWEFPDRPGPRNHRGLVRECHRLIRGRKDQGRSTNGPGYEQASSRDHLSRLLQPEGIDHFLTQC